MTQDFFAHKADSYEQEHNRLAVIDKIAGALVAGVEMTPEMHLMDFGSGTGLLTERVAPRVRKITAVDVSPSMSAHLTAKREQMPCELEMLAVDLETTDIEGGFDGIVSSLTMHHIKDVPAMFSKFRDLVKDGGFIAIADLDQEDGSFHGDEPGVYHLGFVREEFARLAAQAGFSDVTVSTASVIEKDDKQYPVFLLTARK
ncbi:MAG: methyltransferase domain-containing protein [Gammaproteobacteria bacterium]|nr:methyltransferase domain-containing protein [Gammaproteobacteria bacterium]